MIGIGTHASQLSEDKSCSGLYVLMVRLPSSTVERVKVPRVVKLLRTVDQYKYCGKNDFVRMYPAIFPPPPSTGGFYLTSVWCMTTLSMLDYCCLHEMNIEYAEDLYV